MLTVGRGSFLACVGVAMVGGFVACSADRATDDGPGSHPDGGGLDVGGNSDGGGFGGCGSCIGTTYTSCADGAPTSTKCPAACTPNVGCTACSPAGTICVGNEVHKCSGEG